MKFVSLDIETGGLNPEVHSLLEVAAVFVDTDNPGDVLPRFNRVIVDPTIVLDPYVLEMHQDLLDEIRVSSPDDPGCCTTEDIGIEFAYWVENFVDGSILFAGKNVASFDLPWLERVSWSWQTKVKAKHRTLDPAMLYIDWEEDDAPPSLTQCKERSGLFVDTEVNHRALSDALDVATLILGEMV